MWKSPNGTIRAILDGTVFRAPIVVKGIEPCVKNWKKPITIARHAYGDVYKGTEMKIPGPGKAELVYTAPDGTETRELIHNFDGAGIIQGMHNINASIESFARSCFSYALDTKQDLWFATKDTISKKYDHTFKDIFQEIFDAEYKNCLLYTSHDDLVEAEATLKNIIEELDEAMCKQFTEQFAKISQEFNQVFKQLFGGGKGTLELMDDEDVLEAGIRIIAQPPGKKLQNMMQLSGGEKALTAISLLFAIQNLKPSPFCLLDEIEAALDDSNVTRFAQYLHKLTKNTQFIVITHRRGTMTAADRLYGIKMCIRDSNSALPQEKRTGSSRMSDAPPRRAAFARKCFGAIAGAPRWTKSPLIRTTAASAPVF